MSLARCVLLTLSVTAVGPAFQPVNDRLDQQAGLPSRSHMLVEVALPGTAGAKPVEPAILQTWANWLAAQGYSVDRCGHNAATGTITLDLNTEQQLTQLTDAGFTVMRQYGKGRRSESPRPKVRTVDLGPSTLDLGGDFRTQSEYFDPGEIEAMLMQVASDHPAITLLFVIGTTFEGRDIYALEISDNPGALEDEPAIQFNGQHHAREVATSHVVMDVVETLTDGYGVDPNVTAWVDAYKTVCVPMVNLDGVQYVFDTDPWWRKNRHFYPPTCMGVDLNRNYPYLWGPGCGSSGSCSSNTYRGPSLASEQETGAMIAPASAYHFVMATSYHAFGRFIDYPYACSDGSPSGVMPEHDVIHEMMHGVADAIFDVDGVDYAVYSPVAASPVNGDDTSWYYAHMGAYPFIIEVGTNFEPPFSEVPGIVSRNRGGWMYMYERLGQARLDVHVTDACTGEPLEAEVTLTNYVYDTGELPRLTYLPFGRWTYLVEANGSYTVAASRNGYHTQEVTAFVGNAPEAVDIALVPTPPCPGDFDGDNDVDLDDYAVLADCLGGPEVTTPPGDCNPEDFATADLDGDEDVDAADVLAFFNTFTGQPG